MPDRSRPFSLSSALAAVARAIRYAFYDWTREMPTSLRVVTMVGMGIQGYAIWAGVTRSLVWPIMWPTGWILYPVILLIYYVGYCIQNAALSSELIRKTQLESEQRAAQAIQKTLQPTAIGAIPGYEVDASYTPLRAVGGDYFDVIELAGDRMFFAVADVSGKGMGAALLAANIQALVRSLAGTTTDVSSLASQINRHLCRYSPSNRFATAFFLVLDHASGEFQYVNAGHNPPLLWDGISRRFLESTGMALGWFEDASYETGRATVVPGGGILIFTDGLPDSIPGDAPEQRLCQAVDGSVAGTMRNLETLIDPRFTADDITVLLLKRASASVSQAQARSS